MNQKVIKAIVSSVICAIGWIFVIQGWITEFRYKNKEAAKKSYLLSYMFNIPAYILGVLGWNWKEAMSNQVQD